MFVSLPIWEEIWRNMCNKLWNFAQTLNTQCLIKGLYKQDELSIKKLRKKRYYTLTEHKNVCIITVQTTFQVNVGLEKFNPCLP